MAGEVGIVSDAGAVGAEEVRLESCASVGDARWWQLGFPGLGVGALEVFADGVVGIVGSW